VFDDIEDPTTFPPIQDSLPSEDVEVCRRYVEAAEELAESELTRPAAKRDALVRSDASRSHEDGGGPGEFQPSTR
jgi:hypothetical protein